MQAHAMLRYAPRGPGLTAAVLYLVAGRHVYGWYAGASGVDFTASFFALEHFYSALDSRFLHSVGSDLYGRWVERHGALSTEVRNPVPDSLAHELDRLQSAFVDEWLFFADAPGAAAEIAAYERIGLPVRDMNIQSRHFARFDRSEPVWRFSLPGTDLNLVEYLARCWTLDDTCDTVPIA